MSDAMIIDGEFGLQNLRAVERETPAPTGDQLLVRVSAVSLNFRDWLTVQGLYNPRQPLPLVPCSDGAGVVEAVGPQATKFQPGDRVTGAFFENWVAGLPSRSELKTSRGGPLDGMLQRYVCASEQSFVHTPAHLSDEEASTLPCAALTAWSALVWQGGLKAGDTVLTLGTGGVSMFAIQFAQMFGARVIATSSSDEKLAVLRDDFGVGDVINYRDDPGWGRTVRELTDGGVDHVVEVGGAGTLQRSIQAVRAGGTVSLIGVLAGTKSDVDLIGVLMRNVRVQGVIVGPRQQFEAMNRAIEINALRPLIDRTFTFDDTVAAFEHLREQKHMGKVVVKL